MACDSEAVRKYNYNELALAHAEMDVWCMSGRQVFKSSTEIVWVSMLRQNRLRW